MANVLIIDDDDLLSMAMTMGLERAGYQVTRVDDGVPGLALLQQRPCPFDIVLLDYMMPVMDGMQVLENLQNTPLPSHVTVILQTGVLAPDAIEKAMGLGVTYYLAKPYLMKELLELLRGIGK